MKKTLIAVAALAATGAFAQVSVYGRLDVGYASGKTETNTAGVAAEVKNVGVNSHNSASSMWGIQGSEDLGGGMKAIFKLEQDLYVANGNTGTSGANNGVAVNTSGFNRTSLLGLSGGFGTIAFGRDYVPTFTQNASYDLFGQSRVTTMSLAANLGSTAPALIHYTTPNFSGFSAKIAYGNSDESNATASNPLNTADAKAEIVNATGSYVNGPLTVGVGFGTNKATTAAGTPAPAETKTEGSQIGASYDFGVVKLQGNYITQKQTNNANAQEAKQNQYNIGVSAPMGKVRLLAQIGRTEQKNDLIGTDRSGSNWVLGAEYSLSAKTALFVKTGVVAKLEGTVANVQTDTKYTETNVGIRTVF